jgi:hypothetical protein
MVIGEAATRSPFCDDRGLVGLANFLCYLRETVLAEPVHLSNCGEDFFLEGEVNPFALTTHYKPFVD